jgi:hypothetical protein
MKWYEIYVIRTLDGLKGRSREIEFTFKSYTKWIEDGWKPTSGWYEQMCLGMNGDAKMIAQELDVSFMGLVVTWY